MLDEFFARKRGEKYISPDDPPEELRVTRITNAVLDEHIKFEQMKQAQKENENDQGNRT
ncbi:hypothetical protein SEA_MAKAI_59 [Arthrobacter phage Makai]|nr:hypothetical protein SEA_MAKAI_59 [Arthrobacter phage Makai]QPX62521.1 hypothetical protein SEA_TRUCKEE_57 [Arthrobacter phage Truckee]